MTFILLSTELVERIHDAILNPGEIPGRAGDKSLEGALARVDNRLTYGMIQDAFDLAAASAIAIAQGHCFNDGNKRTAHQSMDVCLDLNGIQITWSHEDVGQAIIRAAQRLMDEGELALWLRQRAGAA
jgi:death-on-curing protein